MSADNGNTMNILKLLFALFILASLSFAARAEIQDQGLSSIMDIIDKAIAELNQEVQDDTEIDPAVLENASATVINLSRTLGTLSYSRLQCGEAAVLAEFTQRVQLMPDATRDPMRDAFQEGFDKSKEETPILSQDECERLTRSRKRSEDQADANVNAGKDTATTAEASEEEAEEALPPEDPKFRHLRVAELSGQLAYKRKFCEDETVFNRDYNDYLESIPTEYREEVKTAYWKGYKHGKRLHKNLSREQC
jgi:predicted secreted protein